MNEIDMRVGMDVAQAKAELESLKRSVSGFVNEVRTQANGLRININAQFDDAAARAAIESFRASIRNETIRISVDASGTVGAQGALDGIRNAVLGLGAATATTLPILRDYNDELNRMQLAARAAAGEIRRAAEEQERLRRAGGGGGGGGSQGGGDNDGSVWRKHAAAVANVSNEYSGLAARLLAAKSAMAVLTATASGAIPVLAQMAAVAGAAFGTALATANVAAVSKELENLARSTAISKQALQEWRLAARFEGVSADLNEFGDMSKVFSELDKQVKSLGTEEGKEFAESLKTIGLSAKDLKDAKADEALLKIGEALGKTKLNDAQKSTFLAGISDDAAKLQPLIAQNAKSFAEIKAYANAVGAVQSDAQLESMRQTNRELSFFKVGLEGVQTQLSGVGGDVINTLGPNIRQLFIDAKKPIAEWSRDVDVALKRFKADLDSTDSWTIALKLSLKEAYPTLYGFVASAADFGRGYGQAFITPMIAELKRGYASLSASLGAAGGAEVLGRGLGQAMLPVIAIVHNVAGAVKILIDNWDTLKAVAAVTPVGFAVANWDQVTAVFSAVGNSIKTVVQYFGLITPATAQSASGMQMFTAVLLGLVAAGASTRLALGAVGAAFTVIRFAVAPAILAVQLAPAAFGAMAAAAGAAGWALKALALAAGVTGQALKALALAAGVAGQALKRLNPVIAVVTSVAAIAGALIANWDKVGPFFSSMWSVVTASFNKAFADISSTPWQQLPAKILSGFASFAVDLHKIGGKAIADLAQGILTSIGVPTAAAKRISDGIYTAFVTIPLKALEIGISIVKQLAQGIISLISDPVGTSRRVANAVVDAFTDLPSQLYKKAVDSITQLGAGILQSMGIPKEKALQTAAATVSAFTELPSKLLDMGINTMNSLADGIKSAGASAINAATNIASDIGAAIKSFFGIASPSKLMIGYGEYIFDGLKIGIEEAGKRALQAAKDMASRIGAAIRDFFGIQSPSRLMMGYGEYISEGLAIGIEAKGLQAVDKARVLSAKITNAFKVQAPQLKNLGFTDLKGFDFNPQAANDPQQPKAQNQQLNSINPAKSLTTASLAKDLTAAANAYKLASVARADFTRQQLIGVGAQRQEVAMLDQARASGGWASYLQQMTGEAARQNKTMFEINKAAAIANALINTREAVTSAYKFGARFGGPVGGAAMAAVALAAQMANVKAIASQSFGGGGDSGGSSGGGGDSASGNASASDSNGATTSAATKPAATVTIALEGSDNTMYNKKQVRDLIKQINEAVGDGARLRVA